MGFSDSALMVWTEQMAQQTALAYETTPWIPLGLAPEGNLVASGG